MFCDTIDVFEIKSEIITNRCDGIEKIKISVKCHVDHGQNENTFRIN